MREFFSRDIQGRVVGVTRDICDSALPKAFVHDDINAHAKKIISNSKTSVSWLMRQKAQQIDQLNLLMTR